MTTRFLPALLLLVLVSACTSGGGSSSAPSPSPSRHTPADAPVVQARPENKACYQLDTSQLTKPNNGSQPVGCSRHHNALTIFVGKLRTVVNGHSLAVDSKRVQRQLTTTCPRKLAEFVGGSPDIRNRSRFNVVWFSPTPAQSDSGAPWFRCDLIAFAKQESLLALPSTKKLEGVLDGPHGLDTYGLCGTAAPGAPGFERVICAHSHAWRSVSTIPIAGGKKYPGVDQVRTSGDSTCQSRVRQSSGFSLKFRYGWEWPTREQWNAGQHYGFCWAPS